MRGRGLPIPLFAQARPQAFGLQSLRRFHAEESHLADFLRKKTRGYAPLSL